MNLPKNLVDKFIEWLQKYRGGGENCKQGNELGRFIIGDKIVFVTEYFPRRSADACEVFCSDKDFLEKLEEDWVVFAMADESLDE